MISDFYKKARKDTLVRVVVPHLKCSSRVHVGAIGLVLGVRKGEDPGILVKYEGKAWPVHTTEDEVEVVAW